LSFIYKFDIKIALQIKSNFSYTNKILINIYLNLLIRLKVIYLKRQIWLFYCISHYKSNYLLFCFLQLISEHIMTKLLFCFYYFLIVFLLLNGILKRKLNSDN